MTALRLDTVTKRFGDHHALRGLSLEIGDGEVVCLLGASGSGKTTLLRLVAGLEHADSGRIEIGGRLVDGPGQAPVEPQQRGLGMVFQDYALWPHLDAADNIALPLRARGVRDAQAQAARMLERVGLGGLGARRIHALSGGQQQRVALARALAVRPRLLLCDEPLSNLDAALRDEMRELIAEVAREHGLAVLYITHDQREAFALGDRVGVLAHGRLSQIAAPGELLAAPADAVVARFTHALGPWPGRRRGETVLAPWGALPCRAGADVALEVFLRPGAIRLAEGAAGDATLRVLGSVAGAEHGEGVEVLGELHGVRVRLRAPAPLGRGAEVAVRIDPGRALAYPKIPSTPLEPKESSPA